MRTMSHASLDVRGALRQNIESKGKRALWLVEGDGRPMDREKAIDVLMDMLATGVERLPLGKPCEGWSDKTGCPGHPWKDAGEGGTDEHP